MQDLFEKDSMDLNYLNHKFNQHYNKSRYYYTCDMCGVNIFHAYQASKNNIYIFGQDFRLIY